MAVVSPDHEPGQPVWRVREAEAFPEEGEVLLEIALDEDSDEGLIEPTTEPHERRDQEEREVERPLIGPAGPLE